MRPNTELAYSEERKGPILVRFSEWIYQMTTKENLNAGRSIFILGKRYKIVHQEHRKSESIEYFLYDLVPQ